MSLEQYTEVKGRLIAEFYWAGSYVVYVDTMPFDGSYEEAIAKVQGAYPSWGCNVPDFGRGLLEIPIRFFPQGRPY